MNYALRLPLPHSLPWHFVAATLFDLACGHFSHSRPRLRIGLAWLGLKVNRAVARRHAIKTISELGEVVFAEPSTFIQRNRQLRGWIGDEGVLEVEAIIFAGVSDEQMFHLRDLTEIEVLDLTYTHVSDKGLVYLRTLRHLKVLDLSYTQVGDAGMVQIGELRELQQLSLSKTRVTDVGLSHLRELTQLSDLWLNETRVSDEGLQHLRNLRGLKYVCLFGTNVTESGVMELRNALPDAQVFWDFAAGQSQGR